MNEALRGARALLEAVTPLKHDCGALCGRACCAADADGQGGVYLFPGEAELLLHAVWASTAHTDDLGGCALLTCVGWCAREERPLGCRLFPLTPVKKNGAWTVRLDQRAWAMCPLMPGGLRGLDPAFVDAARQAITLLAGDPAQEPFLKAWAQQERAYRISL